MGKTLSKPKTRKAARSAKRSVRSPRKPKPILTKQELHKWAKDHPTPASFWDGDDDPSKPLQG